mmetsp:Transcript_150769/g.420260  ORF Transcript_150769/g.420260 Transcript_150769/m.420260 type:complete len:245 (-) Transcript_150769:127-861(-)
MSSGGHRLQRPPPPCQRHLRRGLKRIHPHKRPQSHLCPCLHTGQPLHVLLRHPMIRLWRQEWPRHLCRGCPGLRQALAHRKRQDPQRGLMLDRFRPRMSRHLEQPRMRCQWAPRWQVVCTSARHPCRADMRPPGLTPSRLHPQPQGLQHMHLELRCRECPRCLRSEGTPPHLPGLVQCPALWRLAVRQLHRACLHLQERFHKQLRNKRHCPTYLQLPCCRPRRPSRACGRPACPSQLQQLGPWR